MKEISGEWLKSAKDDLVIISKIVDDPTLTHQVAFHAQQSVEKTMKAVMEENSMDFIKTHSLETLWEKIRVYTNTTIDVVILKKLDQLYIDARYPGDLGLLPFGKPSMNEAKEFEVFATSFFETIRKLII